MVGLMAQVFLILVVVTLVIAIADAFKQVLTRRKARREEASRDVGTRLPG
jgi:hypothetical protein